MFRILQVFENVRGPVFSRILPCFQLNIKEDLHIQREQPSLNQQLHQENYLFNSHSFTLLVHSFVTINYISIFYLSLVVIKDYESAFDAVKMFIQTDSQPLKTNLVSSTTGVLQKDISVTKSMPV